MRENVVHWGPEHVDHGIKDRYDETCDTRFTKETLVVSPLNAYSHNVKNDTGADTLKDLYADTDFSRRCNAKRYLDFGFAERNGQTGE